MFDTMLPLQCNLNDILPVLDLHVRDDNEIYINPLRPWYDVPGVDSIFRAVDHNERYQMLANSYRYHSKLMDYVKDFSHEEPLGNGYHSNGNKTIQDIPQNFTQKLDYERDPLKLFFLEKFIQDLINKKIESGQLDNSALTFGELTKIRDTFVRILAAYYHGRIKYQNQKDPDSTGDSEAEKSEKDKSFSSEKDKSQSSEAKSDSSKAEKQEA